MAELSDYIYEVIRPELSYSEWKLIKSWRMDRHSRAGCRRGKGEISLRSPARFESIGSRALHSQDMRQLRPVPRSVSSNSKVHLTSGGYSLPGVYQKEFNLVNLLELPSDLDESSLANTYRNVTAYQSTEVSPK